MNETKTTPFNIPTTPFRKYIPGRLFTKKLFPVIRSIEEGVSIQTPITISYLLNVERSLLDI